MWEGTDDSEESTLSECLELPKPDNVTRIRGTEIISEEAEGGEDEEMEEEDDIVEEAGGETEPGLLCMA